MKNIVNASKKKWIGLDCYYRHDPSRVEIGKAGIFWDSKPTARYNYNKVKSFQLDHSKKNPLKMGMENFMGSAHVRFNFKDGQWVTASFDISNRNGVELFTMAMYDWRDHGIVEDKEIGPEDLENPTEEMKDDMEYYESIMKERV